MDYLWDISITSVNEPPPHDLETCSSVVFFFLIGLDSYQGERAC